MILTSISEKKCSVVSARIQTHTLEFACLLLENVDL